jgi:Ca2+-binding RTX toxin-like protein
MIGGTGNDTYVVDDAGDVVNETGGNGIDTVLSSISFDLSDAGHVIGAVENLTLTGMANINGTGNSKDNVLTGNSHNNVLSGGDGHDTLDGGGGVDTLTGGAGHDVFSFTTPHGLDTITDFATGADVLQVSAAGFGGGLHAGQVVTVVSAASALSAAGPATGYFIFDNSGASQGTLFWDANGGSGHDAVAIAVLQGVTALHASDFHVV